MAEIHEEMSELVDKQVNVQKESLKKLLGFTQNSRKLTKKCAMKIKTHGSESRGQEEAAVRDERVSYLHVALL